MSAIVVTAADEGYAPLLLDLLESLRVANLPAETSVGVVDLGLEDATRGQCAELGARVVKVTEWPFRPHATFDARPRYLSRAVRPFLPRHFPGHDVIVWLDADCWVQEGAAIDHLVRCAKGAGAAFVPAVDRGYVHTLDARAWVDQRNRMAFGDADADALRVFSYINSGVFAMAANAPHWAQWETRFQRALDRWTGDFLSDQAVLNAVVYLDRMPALMMPSEYNWICHLRLPGWSVRQKKLVNPNFPWAPIGIVHNTFNDKQVEVPIAQSAGPPKKLAMTYSAIRKLAAME